MTYLVESAGKCMWSAVFWQQRLAKPRAEPGDKSGDPSYLVVAQGDRRAQARAGGVSSTIAS